MQTPTPSILSCAAWGALCLALTAPAWARDDTSRDNRHYVEGEQDRPWEEVAVPLPDYPPPDAAWLPMYISNTYSARPQLWRDSVHMAPDRTLHYVLNIQSASGLDNISAEAMQCATRSVKIFAFGDTAQRQWTPPRVSAWQPINGVEKDSKATTTRVDRVRSLLYHTFCEDGLPLNDKELAQRMKSRLLR